ncbi:complement C1q-like protein 4 [Saccostrea cucullata]|uniref:complement C1q-like protein 4 n=1 Tax=Saccostrea cuccullata TaxID=36930 RepID=UPI002ED1E7CD
MKKISGLLSRQNVQEKLFRNLKDRLQNLMNSQEEKSFFANALTQHKESLIRKERLHDPVTTTASLNNIVAFYAYLSQDVPSPSAHYILAFDNVITNAGNAYHSHTGTFIAPRSGLYVFTWTIRMYGDSYHSTELLINNNFVGSTYLNSANTISGSVTGIVVVHVNQGDDVFLRTGGEYNNGNIYSDNLGKSSLAGWALA